MWPWLGKQRAIALYNINFFGYGMLLMVSILEENYIPANIKTNLMLIYYLQNGVNDDMNIK
jgi:hypothetical protein